MNGPTNSRFRTARNVFANGIRSSQGANVSLAGGSDVSNALIPRMLILGSIILIGFVALVVKLWHLQFFDYDRHLENAISNTLKHV